MKREKLTFVFIVLLISSILMIANGALVVNSNAPVVAQSFEATNLTSVWDVGMFWGRIVFGFPGLVEGGLAYVWLFFAVLLLLVAIGIYLRPRKQKSFGPWMIILSALTVPIGGGFYIGAVLGAIVGLYGMQLPKSFGETLIGRIVNSLTMNAKAITGMIKNPISVQTTALAVILVAVLSGFGTCLYSFNVAHIYPNGTGSLRQFNANATSDILLKGKLYTDWPVYTSAVTFITIMVVKWILLSALIYLLVVKLHNADVSFSKTISLAGFVYVPEVILFFMPLLFSNEPYLSFTEHFLIFPVSWPLILIYISRVWAFGVLVTMLAGMLDTSRGKATGCALLVATPYALINFLFLVPILQVPGIRIEFTGEISMLLLLGAIALLIAVVLGAFRKE